jgi:hypothetical protein
MTTTMSIRELSRSGKLFDQYDYIDIEDKKAHDYKGVFVPAQYAEMVKGFLVRELEKEKQEKLNRIRQYAGKGRIHRRFDDMSASEIREAKAKEQYGR